MHQLLGFGGTVNVKRIAWFAGIAFLIYFVVQSPDDAADIARAFGRGVGHCYEQIGQFVRNLG
jgi:hypothetical protein